MGPSSLISAGVTLDHRLGASRKDILVAADHDGQRTVFRAGLTTRYRRIEKAGAIFLRRRIKLARYTGRRGRVVDENCAFPER